MLDSKLVCFVCLCLCVCVCVCVCVFVCLCVVVVVGLRGLYVCVFVSSVGVCLCV